MNQLFTRKRKVLLVYFLRKLNNNSKKANKKLLHNSIFWGFAVFALLFLSAFNSDITSSPFSRLLGPGPVGSDPMLTICNMETLNVDLQSLITDGSTGVTFEWAAADNPNVTGETTATSTAASITDMLENTSTMPQMVIYTVTPTSSDGTCVGDPFMVTVTVNPTVLADDALLFTADDIPVDGFTAFTLSNADVDVLEGQTGMTVTYHFSAADATNDVNPLMSPYTNTTINNQTIHVRVEDSNGCFATNTVELMVGTLDLSQCPANCNSSDFVIDNVFVSTTPDGMTPLASSDCLPPATEVEVYLCVAFRNTTSSSRDGVFLSGDLNGVFFSECFPGVVPGGVTVTYCTTQSFIWQCGTPLVLSNILTTWGTASQVVCSFTNCNQPNGSKCDTPNDIVIPTPLSTSFMAANACNGNNPYETVTFTATTIGGVSPYTYAWNFGNGMTGGNMNPISHTYLAPGTYSVTLTVTDSDSPAEVAMSTMDVLVSDCCELMEITNPAICSGGTTAVDISSNVPGTMVTWTAALQSGTATGFSDQPTPVVVTASGLVDIAQTLTNTATTNAVVRYTITPVAATCSDDPITVDVTVMPEPVGSDPTPMTCSDVALNISLQNQITNGLTGVTFSWSAAANPNVTGETTTTSTATSITDILTNTTNSDQTVVYTVTPTSADNCTGDSFTVTVTVKREPIGSDPTPMSCSDVALNISLQNQITNGLTGVTFSWSAAANANVSGETTTTSTAANITDVLTNTTGSDQTVVYTVTPTSSSADGSCTGDPFTVTVTVKPEPVGNDPTPMTCSDVALNISLQNQITNGLTGVTFSWSAAANANVAGETTTTSTATSITDVLTNTTGSDQTVVYTVTPTSADNCVGDPFMVTVTVKSEPVGSDPTPMTCSDVALNISLQNQITNGMTGVTFSWSAAANANVTGETTTMSTASSITDVLTNTTGSDQTVVYTITPTSSTGDGGCTGDPFMVTVTVKPEPIGSDPTPMTCSDVALNIALQDQITNGLTGVTFSWSAAANANVTGETTTTSTASSITDVLTNTTNTDQTVIYTVTPTSADGCTGNPFTVTVMVKREPVGSDPTPMTCSDIALNVVLQNQITNGLTGVSFSWSAAANANVSGETTTTSNSGSITDVLTNTTGSDQTVVYTVTPTSSMSDGGCTGDPFTVTVTVKSEPVGDATATYMTCSDVALNINLQTEITNGMSGVSFSWSAAANANVSGETTSTSTSSSITDVLTNTTGSDQTVVYTVTPTSSTGDGSCTGDPFMITVTVKPEPVGSDPMTMTCSDVALNINLQDQITNGLTGVTFSWSAAANANVTGETTTTSTASSITDVLTNTTSSDQTVVYTVTPTSSTADGGCTGNPFTVTVTVKPEPMGSNLVTMTCSDIALNINLQDQITNGLTGVSFSWQAAPNANVMGETSSTSTASSITDNLNNVSGSDQTVIYTVTPSSGEGCEGDPFTVSVTVKSEPVGNDNPTFITCSDEALNINLQGEIANGMTGVSFSWVAANNPNVTGETTTPSSASTITDVLTNTTGSSENVVYTVTPTSSVADGACIGDPFTITVMVRSESVGNTLSTTTCSDVGLNIDLEGQIGNGQSGVTFEWSAADNPNVAGETTSTSTAGAITDVLTNVTSMPQIVVYTVTPTSSSSCIGDPFDIEVTVNPEPVGSNLVTMTCSDVALNVDLSNQLTNNLTGVTFMWMATDNPNVTGETTTPSTANSISDNLNNVSGSDQMVTYTITPSSAEGCEGDPFMVTVTVKSEPVGDATATYMTCSDVALNINLQTEITNGMSGVTFMWVATANANVTGETTTTSTAGSITDVLTNVTGTDQVVVYTVTPTSSVGDGSCVGDAFMVTVTVKPEPVGNTAALAMTCSDIGLNIDLQSEITNGLTGVSFSWSAADNANVTGETTTTSTAGVITDVLTNVTASDQIVVYTVTPTSSTADGGCEGDAFMVTVTVKPEPVGDVAAAAMTCSDVALSIDLQSEITNGLTGVSFSWVGADNSNVTGETLSTSTASSITDVLNNVSGVDQDVIYTVTPTSSAGDGSCEGDAFEVRATVKSEPMGSDPEPMTCSDVALNVDLQSQIMNGLTGVTFRLDGNRQPQCKWRDAIDFNGEQHNRCVN